MDTIFNEFDKVYEEYKDYILKEDWGNANDARNFMYGMARCMQLLYKKEMGKFLLQEVLKRCELAKGNLQIY